MKNKVELLSPVGNFESLEAAICYGADSIYFGIDKFNLRLKSAKSFKLTDLKEIVSKCKKHKIKTYITLNTIIYEKDLKLLQNLLQQIKNLNLDGIIAMDQSVINYSRKLDINVHLSTQLNISNYESIKFYSQYAEAIVLSRELNLKQITELILKIKQAKLTSPKGNLIKIEVFCHGAFCLATSGKCYLSLQTKNSSANRGACNQTCRNQYYLIDKNNRTSIEVSNEHLLSSKDLCTISCLDKIIKTGISILKIEGRARSTEYVAVTTACYREAIDSIKNNTYTIEKIDNWIKRLNNVYHRGFWQGYYLGRQVGKVNSSLHYKNLYIGKVKHYFNKAKIGLFNIESYYLNQKDKIFILGPQTAGRETVVKSILINDLKSKRVRKGQICTIPIHFKINVGDKLYKKANIITKLFD
ncbi:peptidase U32 family protein [Candidatus Karelsulcia muelleri]